MAKRTEHKIQTDQIIVCRSCAFVWHKLSMTKKNNAFTHTHTRAQTHTQANNTENSSNKQPSKRGNNNNNINKQTKWDEKKKGLISKYCVFVVAQWFSDVFLLFFLFPSAQKPNYGKINYVDERLIKIGHLWPI